MFIVAITGGIATGKSTVTKIFKDNGVPVVDADLIARQGKKKKNFNLFKILCEKTNIKFAYYIFFFFF